MLMLKFMDKTLFLSNINIVVNKKLKKSPMYQMRHKKYNINI